MPLVACPLLTQMATAALSADQDTLVANAALLDCLQEHPLPDAGRPLWQKGNGCVPKWVYEAICQRTGSRVEGWTQLGTIWPDFDCAFRYSMRRAHLAGSYAWLAQRSDGYVNGWQFVARLARALSLGLFLAHDPARRRFPWLMGLVDRPTIGLTVYRRRA